MYLNPNDNKTIYPIYNKLNNLNLTEQEQNNLYSGYNISNNTYNISNNTNNLNKNKIKANIIPKTNNQISYMEQTHYQPQVENYINSNENGISNAINNNIKINNEVNKNGMNIVNQYNKVDYINKNNIIKIEEEKGKPMDTDRNKIRQSRSENRLFPLNANKKKAKVNKLKLNEEILLRNQKQSLNKDLDVKTHFDIEVTKEKYVFPYKKVLKIAIPLLSHYEMPTGCNYKSPLLSPDGQYLSCIASLSSLDVVYVWNIDNLYWFKFKFSVIKSKVDYVAFTPDSKCILVIYRQNNPILYDLKTGSKLLELEKNGEENNRDGLHCAFTVKGTHFCYTTDKSFTLWNLKNGKIKKIIKDDSPIKLLFNEYIISIKNDLICEIKNFKNLKIIESFKLKGIASPKDILDARFSPDMSCFIYIIKKGVIKYILKEKKFKGVQKFQLGVEKAVISDDCRFVAKTNLRNLTIYDIERGETIGTILKEKFNEFKIDFNNEKLIVIDNICINIHDYTDGGIPEQFVWLDKNPIRFVDVKFSPDFKFLFGLTEKNNVILYDLNTGLIIKKWQNIEKNWNNFSISEGPTYKTASTSNIFLVKIWGYITGREDATFFGFDSYSFNFSHDGNYLACGAKNGPEIARILNLEKGTFGSFLYVGNNSNFHTVVNLTSPEPTRLICCSIDQQPLIFDTNSK
jgi:WD40 repeat protein